MNVRLFTNCFLAAAAGSVSYSNAQVNKGLINLGMENVRYAEVDGGSITAFEDRTFRSSYHGVGKAIEAALGEQKEGSISLIITDKNGIPQLKVFIDGDTVRRFANGSIGLAEVYSSMELGTNADSELAMLEGVETEQRSAWRPDFVIYPQLFLENNRLDVIYSYVISLAPALQMPLWKGAELNAQVIFPIAGNTGGEIKTIRPGIVTLSQGLYLKKNWSARITGGLFDNNRAGASAEVMWRSPKGRWEAGGKLGATSWTYFGEGGWTITKKPKIDASIYGRAYIPGWNTEVYVSANRFVYGDYGTVGEVVRHFGEYTVGVYAMVAGGDLNGGFSFAVPLPGKKYNRWKGVRIKPADYFNFRYGMVAWGEYIDHKRGIRYNTDTDNNRSKGFYQPEYIKYFLIKSLERNNNN